jgi:hypothetical protein
LGSLSFLISAIAFSRSVGRASCAPPVASIVVRHADQNLPGDDLREKAFEMSPTGINPLAIQGVELPVMTTARQSRAVEIALDKGDPQMGAAPLIGTEAPIELEEQDGGIAHAEALHLAFPEVFNAANFHEIRL